MCFILFRLNIIIRNVRFRAKLSEEQKKYHPCRILQDWLIGNEHKKKLKSNIEKTSSFGLNFFRQVSSIKNNVLWMFMIVFLFLHLALRYTWSNQSLSEIPQPICLMVSPWRGTDFDALHLTSLGSSGNRCGFAQHSHCVGIVRVDLGNHFPIARTKSFYEIR